jgi:hypothetical protein
MQRNEIESHETTGKQKVRQGFLANLGTNYMSEGYRHR